MGLGDPVIVSVIVRRRPQVGGENLTLSLAERFFLTADHAEYADTFRVFCVVRGYRSGRRSAAGTLGESGQRSVSLIVSLEFRIMKTSQPPFFLLFFAGMVLMSFFGSEISRSIGRSDSWTSHLMLPGYSLGLIVISGSMFLRLTSKMRDLESKVQKLEKIFMMAALRLIRFDCVREPNKSDAANPAIASGLQHLYRWRGVADTGRSAHSALT